jgi:hypothetical protein
VCLTAAKDVSHLPYHISPDVEVSKKQVEESCLHLEEVTRWIDGPHRIDNTLMISLLFSLREAVLRREAKRIPRGPLRLYRLQFRSQQRE